VDPLNLQSGDVILRTDGSIGPVVFPPTGAQGIFLGARSLLMFEPPALCCRIDAEIGFLQRREVKLTGILH
jgi:hypothetical protein